MKVFKSLPLVIKPPIDRILTRTSANSADSYLHMWFFLGPFHGNSSSTSDVLQEAKMTTKALGTIARTALIFVFTFPGVAFAQLPATTEAGRTEQTFATTTSIGAECVNPPGPCGALVSLPIDLERDSLLIITFSARGVVFQPTPATVETDVSCYIDGTPCQPNFNGVQFLYPKFCCDARSFTWVVHSAGKGSHTVTINWTTLNTGISMIQNRSLVVQAARLH